jgi:hypothetical protein
MGESGTWGSSRLITVLAVLTLHGAAIWLLLTAPPGPGGVAASGGPLELVFVPPTQAPKMLADSARPKHLRADVGLTVAPPSLDGLLPAAPASQAGSSGAGVNWTAEAERALMAYEIRRDQGVQHATLGLSLWDGWLPPRQLRPGERIRTESGDWIVWINGRCYQIASWHRGATPQNPSQTPTTCTDQPVGAKESPADAQGVPPD